MHLRIKILKKWKVEDIDNDKQKLENKIRKYHL